MWGRGTVQAAGWMQCIHLGGDRDKTREQGRISSAALARTGHKARSVIRIALRSVNVQRFIKSDPY